MSNQKYTVLALFFTILIDALGWGIAFPVLAPIILNNSADMLSPDLSLATKNFLYELALGIYCLFMFLMSPILGSLSDKYGRKKVLIVSMSGNFLGFFLSALAIPLQSFSLLLIGRSVAGATAGSLPIAQAAMIDISSESEKASRLGLVVLANVSGFAIGPVIGGIFMSTHLFHHVNYQVPFFISAFMGLLGALFLAFFFRETFHGNRELKIHIFTSFVNLFEAFTEKTTLRYCMVLLYFLLGWGMFFSTLPVLLTERLQWAGSDLGYFITYIAVIFAIIILFVMPKINAKFPLPKIVSTGLIFLFLCNAIFPTIHLNSLPWLVMLLAIAVPFIYVGTVTLLSMQVEAHKQGQIMGVTGSIFAFTWGIGPLFSGYLLKFGLTEPYFLSGLFILLAAVFAMRKSVMAKP